MQLERMTLFPEFKPWSVIAVVLRTTGPQKCSWGCWFRHFQVPGGRKGERSLSYVRSCTLEIQHGKGRYLGPQPCGCFGFCSQPRLLIRDGVIGRIKLCTPGSYITYFSWKRTLFLLLIQKAVKSKIVLGSFFVGSWKQKWHKRYFEVCVER